MLLRSPLESTKSPSRSAASLMRGARSGTRLTSSPLPVFVNLQGLVEGPEIYMSDERADLARLDPCGVEPGFDAGVDLGQELHGLVEGPDQLFFGYVVERVGEPLELVDLLLETPQIVLLFPSILHRFRTIHHPDPVFGPRKARARSVHDCSLRPCSARRRAPRPSKQGNRERHNSPDKNTVARPPYTYFVTLSMAFIRSFIISSEAPSRSARSSTKSFKRTVFIRLMAEKMALVCWTMSAYVTSPPSTIFPTPLTWPSTLLSRRVTSLLVCFCKARATSLSSRSPPVAPGPRWHRGRGYPLRADAGPSRAPCRPPPPRHQLSPPPERAGSPPACRARCGSVRGPRRPRPPWLSSPDPPSRRHRS